MAQEDVIVNKSIGKSGAKLLADGDIIFSFVISKLGRNNGVNYEMKIPIFFDYLELVHNIVNLL